MKQHLADQHYGRLGSHERFALLLEAMARRDEQEADRLEETCPKQIYRCEDRAFRDRMIRAYMIGSRACLGMQAGLEQLRMAKAFQACAGQFGSPTTRLAQAALLYGRAYGKWEPGKIDTIEMPDAQNLAGEVAVDPELGKQLEELDILAQEVLQQTARNLLDVVGRVHASDVLSRWEGFGRFCRESLGMEPMVLMRAFGFRMSDVAEEVYAAYPGARIDEVAAREWADRWARTWRRRFGSR